MHSRPALSKANLEFSNPQFQFWSRSGIWSKKTISRIRRSHPAAGRSIPSNCRRFRDFDEHGSQSRLGQTRRGASARKFPSARKSSGSDRPCSRRLRDSPRLPDDSMALGQRAAAFAASLMTRLADYRRAPVVPLHDAIDDHRAKQDSETGQHPLALGCVLQRNKHILA